MKQALYFIKLRFKMSTRLIARLGWVRFVLLFVLFLAFLAQFLVDQSSKSNWAFLVLAGGIICSIHLKRVDIAFIQSVSPNYRLIIAFEYGLSVLPIVAILAFKSAMIPAILLFSFSIGLPYIFQGGKFKEMDPTYYLPTLFPVQSYEWIAGVRRNTLLFYSFLCIGTLLFWTHYLVGIVMAFGITLLVSSFYTENEPRRFLLLIADKPASFLIKKLAWGIGLYILFTLPIWMGTLLLFSSQLNYTLLLWLANIILLSSVIIGKYAFYVEAQNMEIPIGTVLVLFCFCIVVPYLQILVPVFWALLFAKSLRRLKDNVYA